MAITFSNSYYKLFCDSIESIFIDKNTHYTPSNRIRNILWQMENHIGWALGFPAECLRFHLQLLPGRWFWWLLFLEYGCLDPNENKIIDQYSKFWTRVISTNTSNASLNQLSYLIYFAKRSFANSFLFCKYQFWVNSLKDKIKSKFQWSTSKAR